MARLAGPAGAGGDSDDGSSSGGQSGSQSREVGELSNERQTVAERRQQTREERGEPTAGVGNAEPSSGNSSSGAGDTSQNRADRDQPTGTPGAGGQTAGPSPSSPESDTPTAGTGSQPQNTADRDQPQGTPGGGGQTAGPSPSDPESDTPSGDPGGSEQQPDYSERVPSEDEMTTRPSDQQRQPEPRPERSAAAQRRAEAVADEYDGVSAREVRFTEDGQLAEQTREEIVGQRVQDRIDADVSPGEDYRVSIQDGEANITWTESGREALAESRQEYRESIAGATSGAGDAAQRLDARDFLSDEFAAAEAQVEEDTGLEAGEDFTITLNEDGEYVAQPTDDYQAEQAQERAETRDRRSEAAGRIIEKQGGDLDRAEAQTGRDLDQDDDVTSPEEYVASQVDEEFDTLERGRDYRVVEDDDGAVTVAYTDRGVTAVEAELEGQTGRNVDVQRRDSGGIDVEVGGRQEQFGDGELRFAGTSLEEQLGGASDVVQSTADDVAGAVESGFDLGATALQGAAPGDTKYQRQAASAVRTGGDIAGGAVRGIGAIADLPGLALTIKEAGETTGYVVKQTAAGEGSKAVGNLNNAAVGAISRGGQYAANNPAQTIGMVGGSLVAGYGATRAASRVSPGAGRAAAAVVDPVEYAVGGGVTRVASATTRGQRAVNALGGRIDTESVARYAGRGASQRVRRATDAATQSFRRFRQDTRGQQDLTFSRQDTTGEVDADTETITAKDLDIARDGPDQGVDRPAGRPQEAPDRSAYERRRSSRQQRTNEDLTPYADDAAMRAVRDQTYSWQNSDAADVRAQAEAQTVRVQSELAQDIGATIQGYQTIGAARSRVAAAQQQQARPQQDAVADVRADAFGRLGQPFDSRVDTRVGSRGRVGMNADVRSEVDVRTDGRVGSQQDVQRRVTQRATVRSQFQSNTRQSTADIDLDPDPQQMEDLQAQVAFDQDVWDVSYQGISEVVFDDGQFDGGGF